MAAFCDRDREYQHGEAWAVGKEVLQGIERCLALPTVNIASCKVVLVSRVICTVYLSPHRHICRSSQPLGRGVEKDVDGKVSSACKDGLEEQIRLRSKTSMRNLGAEVKDTGVV